MILELERFERKESPGRTRGMGTARWSALEKDRSGEQEYALPGRGYLKQLEHSSRPKACPRLRRSVPELTEKDQRRTSLVWEKGLTCDPSNRDDVLRKRTRDVANACNSTISQESPGERQRDAPY